MKSKFLFLFSVVFLSVSLSGISYAGTASDEALNACKSFTSKIYKDEDFRSRVKRIRTRGGRVEIKLNISIEGERFKAVCLVSSEGDLVYSTDREGELKQVVIN